MARTTTVQDKTSWFMIAAGAGLLLAGLLRRKPSIGFHGASVLITGGSRGLGLELARLFAREGARLTLVARDREELERARRELIALGGYVVVHECDIRQRDQVERVVEQVISERGRIDVLINNAGVIQVGPLEHSAVEDFEENLGVYVRGPLYFVKAVVPYMKLQGGGRIVNVSSVAGLVAIPHLAAYSTAKFALTGLSDALRAELAKDGILVTTVAPGLMRTGSHVNALFKGRHRREFGWFSLAAAAPVLSAPSSRAARRIVEACRTGESYCIITGPARALRLANALFPRVTAAVMKLAARILPSPSDASGDELRTGWESLSALSPSLLTRPADAAIGRNNEQKQYAAG